MTSQKLVNAANIKSVCFATVLNVTTNRINDLLCPL